MKKGLIVWNGNRFTYVSAHLHGWRAN